MRVWTEEVRGLRATGLEIVWEQWKLLLDEAQDDDERSEIWVAITLHDHERAFQDWLENQS